MLPFQVKASRTLNWSCKFTKFNDPEDWRQIAETSGLRHLEDYVSRNFGEGRLGEKFENRLLGPTNKISP
jgi:hypothetical protein